MAPNLLVSVIGILAAAAIIVFLILVIRKTKPTRLHRTFLILAGASLAGFFLFTILHNAVSALLSQYLNKEIEEPVFLILAGIACPLGMAVGVTGSIITLLKEKKVI